MTLSVSQIAWQPGEDGEAHALLSGMGIGVLEAAPTRHFPYGLDVVTEEELIGLRRGAEGAGMRRLTGEKCDFLVRIPMRGTVPCLNVSVAAGVCLFEAVRQREGK